MNTSTKPTSNEAENGNKSKPLLQAVFLAPYLPFALKIEHPTIKIKVRQISELKNIGQTNIEISHRMYVQISECKPILKPMSKLIKDKKVCDEINEYLEPNGLEINGWFLLRNSLNAVAISYEEMQKLLNILYREHYDVFGLINKGLAISVDDVV